MTTPRLIAFYLPQYHPIPENDTWWGQGFTEWLSVVKARPLFPGHDQPHLPADLGFYDLRLPDTRQAQAELAREYGIHGFCYFHYWFQGRRLLEQPFNAVLESGQPDFPFCLCWANHHWSRAWDGQRQHVLLEQTYSEHDDREHIRWLARAFSDPRYIRVEGKPLFLIYEASQLPDPLRTTTLWRDEARQLGVGELFLCKVDNFQDRRLPPQHSGFDAAVEFQPDTAMLLSMFERAWWRLSRGLKILRGALICSYANWVRRVIRQPLPSYRRFPCVTPGWDNSPRRRSGAFILHGTTPTLYEQWLAATLRRQPLGPSERIVFINAWNEWAEGNHLEPCQRWGRAYLEATRRAVQHAR